MSYDEVEHSAASQILGDSDARTALRAESATGFVKQQVAPLLYGDAYQHGTGRVMRSALVSERDFWRQMGESDGNRPTMSLLGDCVLEIFRISDWFPRAPGVFWTRRAQSARNAIWSLEQEHDPRLGGYYRPQEKMSLIENGGLGTIRLRPRRIDGEYCWFGTAATGEHCCSGVPLAIPETLLRHAGLSWGDTASVSGRIRFLQDAHLHDIAQEISEVRPLILFVEELRAELPLRGKPPLILSPVVLLRSEANEHPGYHDRYSENSYTFAQCKSGSETQIDSVCEWMETYALNFSSRIITNFDEQRPNLANAPLSSQRLVAKTYDRAILHQYGGTVMVERLETLIHYDSSTHCNGDVHMGDNINAAGNAVVVTRSPRSQVTGASATGLNTDQSKKLNGLVDELKHQLASLQVSHPEEAEDLSDAADKVVRAVDKPETERNKPLLASRIASLLETIKIAEGVAPPVIHAAKELVTFVRSLM